MGDLVKRLREQREFSVVLDEAAGVSVVLRRPAEAEMPIFRELLGVEVAQRFAVGWSGVTEAFLLGEAVGSDDAVPWDAEVWAEVVADRSEWIGVCVKALAERVGDHLQAKADAGKN